MATWEGRVAYRSLLQAPWRQLIGRIPAEAGRLVRVGGFAVLVLAFVIYSLTVTSVRVAQRAGALVADRRLTPTSVVGSWDSAAGLTLQSGPSSHAARPSVSWGSVTNYVVSFGQFPHRQAAEAQASQVRRKGYVATVTRVGSSFNVISRPYANKTRAEFWADVFRQVGLQANVANLPTTLNPTN